VVNDSPGGRPVAEKVRLPGQPPVALATKLLTVDQTVIAGICVTNTVIGLGTNISVVMLIVTVFVEKLLSVTVMSYAVVGVAPSGVPVKVPDVASNVTPPGKLGLNEYVYGLTPPLTVINLLIMPMPDVLNKNEVVLRYIDISLFPVVPILIAPIELRIGIMRTSRNYLILANLEQLQCE
jgi:hypothetical protein